MAKQEKDKLQPVVRSIDGFYSPSTANAENMTVEVTLSTEAPYMRRTWDGDIVNEVLSHDPAHIRLDRMQTGAPVLDNHDRYSSVDDCVVGVVESVRIDSNTKTLVALVRFDRGEKGTSIFRKVAEGILRKLSVGYTVFALEDHEEEGKTTTRTVTDWEPYEVSVVAVPADNDAQTRSKESNILITNLSPMKTENVAPEGNTSAPADETRAAAPSSTTPQVAPTQEVRNAAPVVDAKAVANAERSRVRTIQDQCRMAGLDDDFADSLIDRNVNLSDASRAITAEWKKGGTPPVVGNVTPNAQQGGDEVRNLVDGLAGAIMHRAGIADGDMTDNERRYENMSMVRMATEILNARQESTRNLTDLQIAKRAFTRSHSSTDFPIIFGNVVNRALQRAYAYQGRTFLPWTSSTTHSDFRMVEKSRLSSMVGALDRIPEGGEYKAGTFTESKEGYAVHKFGKLLTFTWEMAVNDDIGFFKRIPAAFALAAAQRQSDLVYAILTGNPNMGDGTPLFHADHNNLGTAADLTDESLADANEMFMNQTDEDGKYINVQPKYLIVGTSRKHAALKMLSSVAHTKTADVNLHANAYELIVEPRIGNAWFLAADPNQIDTVEYAFLAGQPELYTETQENFNIDGTQMKARMVFGAKALDWRGLYMNPGA